MSNASGGQLAPADVQIRSRKCQDCDRTDLLAQGRCNRCYIRYRKSDAFTLTPTLTVDERIALRVKPDQNGCLVWQGSLNNKGYGQITLWVDGERHGCLVHRVVYERARGPIPEGLVLDHLCSNRACANVDHLEPVTQRENNRRAGVGRRLTHCRSGRHLLAETAEPRHDGGRNCSACRNEYEKARGARRSAARAARREGSAA